MTAFNYPAAALLCKAHFCCCCCCLTSRRASAVLSKIIHSTSFTHACHSSKGTACSDTRFSSSILDNQSSRARRNRTICDAGYSCASWKLDTKAIGMMDLHNIDSLHSQQQQQHSSAFASTAAVSRVYLPTGNRWPFHTSNLLTGRRWTSRSRRSRYSSSSSNNIRTVYTNCSNNSNANQISNTVTNINSNTVTENNSDKNTTTDGSKDCSAINFGRSAKDSNAREMFSERMTNVPPSSDAAVAGMPCRLSSANATSRRQWAVHSAALREVLKRAEFVAIDMELTGLHMRSEKFVGVERCYDAHCEGARTFIPIQIGLCAARRAEQPHHWILTPASVYLFPTEPRFFQASTSTLSFLRESGIDFNEWISNGVPFMRAQEEKEKREAFEARIADLEQMRARACEESSLGNDTSNRGVSEEISPISLASPEDRRLADSVRAAINAWLNSSCSSNSDNTEDKGDNDEDRANSSSSSKEPLLLPVENPLQRLLLHSLISSEFPSLSSHSVKVGDKRVLAIYRSEEEVYNEQINSLKEEIEKLSELRGVRQLLDDISEKKLLIVGHNCFYDFLHLFQTLYGELPESVASFKHLWTQTFPYTFDTKLIAESHDLLAALQQPATLKGLCNFMAAISAAAAGKTEKETSNLFPNGHPAPLKVQLENLPGTKWSLPPLVQSVAISSTDLTSELPKQKQQQLGVDSIDRQEWQRENDWIAERPSTTLDESEDFSHDAGFDSLMTSVVFLLQLAHVMPHHALQWKNLTFPRTPSIGEPMKDKERLYSQDSEKNFDGKALDDERQSQCSVLNLLPLFVNKIRLSRSQPASINLGGEDEQLQHQRRLLLMKNHPASWKKWEIMKIWSPVWVDVQPVDSSTSWIIARDEEDVQNILTIYEMMKSPQFQLLNYDQYRAKQREQQQHQQL